MIVTRIPPSPTGALHIGTVRTALFNYIFAKQNNGKVVFRSEDTDKARSKREYEDAIVAGLQALGIHWDGEVVRQSERSAIYRQHLEMIIQNGTAYLSVEESKSNPGTSIEVVRLKNPNKKITFNDMVRGEISFDTTELGDIVIARNLDDALYHFTVVVDDQLMGVTHVIRGDDHISNTPRQILIQEALGWERPIYAHLPLILATDRSKMSKRTGVTSIATYLDNGFLPAAIINYLALLGWNPGNDQEILSFEEIIAQFSIEKIQKGGAIFDINKFNWINREYLKKLSADEFSNYLTSNSSSPISICKMSDEKKFAKLIPVIRERVNNRAEAVESWEKGEYDFAFGHVSNYDRELLLWKNDTSLSVIKPRLEAIYTLLKSADFSSADTIKSSIWEYVEKTGKGEVLWPMRVALSGQKQSPDPFTIAYIIGQSETLVRLSLACDKIGKC